MLLSYLPHNEVALKNSGEGRSSQWAEIQTKHLVIHFVWKEED